MTDQFVENDSVVHIPCPDPECDESYDVTVLGRVSGTLTESCEGCEKKIWVSEKSITPTAKFFNIYSGDGGPNNYSARYKRVDLEERIWERL